MYKPQDIIVVGTEDPNWCPPMSSGMMAIHMQTDTLWELPVPGSVHPPVPG